MAARSASASVTAEAAGIRSSRHTVAASAIAARELPASIAHAERAWDFFTSTDALTRDASANLRGLAQVIATLKQTGLLAKSAADDPAAYVDDSYLKAARG